MDSPTENKTKSGKRGSRVSVESEREISVSASVRSEIRVRNRVREEGFQ